jgi:hypothetical protein
MVVGWKLSTWVPTTVHEQEQEKKLSGLKRMQGDAEWKAKVDEYARSIQGQPRFEVAGRLVFFAGLVLFIIAGVRMYWAPAVKSGSENDSERQSDYEESFHREELR